jgi:hypothetical protein
MRGVESTVVSSGIYRSEFATRRHDFVDNVYSKHCRPAVEIPVMDGLFGWFGVELSIGQVGIVFSEIWPQT